MTGCLKKVFWYHIVVGAKILLLSQLAYCVTNKVDKSNELI